MKKRKFGVTKNGKDVMIYSLENSKGMKAEIINYGAILVNLFVPNKDGKIADVVLGYDSLEEYFENENLFGAIAGPIANRTKDAKFELNGEIYNLSVNDGKNNLHTDLDEGLHKRYYEVIEHEADHSVTFVTRMSDGELGLPGNREFRITYSVTEENELAIAYEVTTDKDTIVNITNHSYFNLSGHDMQLVLDTRLIFNADKITEIMPGGIPTGKLLEITQTEFDFMTPHAIGERIDCENEQLRIARGYDHNYVLKDYDGNVRKVATAMDEKAGRTMEVYTDLPGLQFYSGNFIKPHKGKGNVDYARRQGFALETQYFPNSVNEPAFEKPLVTKEKPFISKTIYKFV